MYLVGRMCRPTHPLKLPWCSYPIAAEVQMHGLLYHEKDLPLVDFERALPYRSLQYAPIPLNKIDSSEVMDVVRLVAHSFAVNEPMNRHVHPPKQVPKQLMDATHHDVFGNDSFGAWTSENLLFWFIRLMLVTDPSHSFGAIGIDDNVFRHTLVFLNDHSKPIGASINSTLPNKKVSLRKSDPFIEATFLYQNPIIDFLHLQEGIAIKILDDNYPHFNKAHQLGKVGFIAMIARSTELPAEHTFELFVASFESFQNQGYEYMLIAGSNQWTGAACEVLGAARIYFTPFRDKQRVAKENVAEKNEPFSTDGFISCKDSGLMIYALKLQK